jgi:hypothetical protein
MKNILLRGGFDTAANKPAVYSTTGYIRKIKISSAAASINSAPRPKIQEAQFTALCLRWNISSKIFRFSVRLARGKS